MMHRIKSALKGILVLFAFAIIGVIIAIQITKRPIIPSGETVSIALPDVAPEVAAAVSFTIAITATAGGPEAALFEGGSWFRMRGMAHSAMLICHPRGLLVFDTGLGRDVFEQFKAFPFLTRQMVAFKMTSPLVDQKVMDDFCPDRSIELVPSHLHWDHAGGIEDFPDLPVWAVPGPWTLRALTG